MDPVDMGDDLAGVLLSEAQIAARLDELAAQIDRDYAGKAVLIHCDADCGPAASPGVQIAKHAIEQAGGAIELHEYAGTHHAFFNDDRPDAYDRRAAGSAWARTLELLRARLG